MLDPTISSLTQRVEPAAAEVPWRRRHPVVSRAVLYGLGLCLLGVLGWALAQRSDRDEADRTHALRLQLQNLSILLMQDPEGATTLAALEGEYAEEALPPSLHALRQRMRALALRSAARHDDACAASARAVALAGDGLERVCAEIEWAHTLHAAGRPAEARARLTALPRPLPGDPTLSLLVGLADAGAREAIGDRPGALDDLRDLLGTLRAPLPDGPEVEVEGHAWTPGEAAFLLVEFAIRGGRASSEPGAELTPDLAIALWQQLQRLGPQDARIAVEAARGLLRAGDADGAAVALQRARLLDVRLTTAYVRNADDAAFQELAADLPLPLKSGSPSDR